MKWIADINLSYHNVANVKSIWLHNIEYKDEYEQVYFEIRLSLLDDCDNNYYVVDRLYMDIDQAKDYLVDLMTKSFGKESLLFTWDDS